MLEEGVGDHGHQRITMQALPGSALEVVKTEFFLHLLVSLFANPTRLDGGCQGAQAKVSNICPGTRLGSSATSPTFSRCRPKTSFFVPVRQLMVRHVAVGQQLKFAAVRVRVTD